MAVPNFFKDYFYGRSGQRDLTEADLPQNRIQLFRDVLSVRKGSMVGVNFLYLLCWIPSILWTALNTWMLYSEGYTLSQLSLTYMLVLCPLMAITGPFNVGVSYIMRNWARDEHSYVWSDFIAAMKDNGRQGLLLGLVSGILPLVSLIALRFYGEMMEYSLIFALPMAITIIIAVLWNLSAMILPMMLVTYRQSFFAQVRNAVLMTLAQLPKALLIRLATWALPLLLGVIIALNIPIFGIAVGITVVLYMVIMLTFNKLIQASFANALCEKYLNSQIEGAQTDIGLYPKKENEE